MKEQSGNTGFWNRQVGTLLAFNAAYLIVAAVVAMGRANKEFAFYLAVMFVLGAAIMVAHARFRLSLVSLWCLSIWGLGAHMAGGLMPVPASWPIDGDIRVLYSWWILPGLLKYDQIVHAFGFGTTAWVCWEGLRAILANERGCERSSIVPTFGMLLLCATAGMGFGALNEIVEFIAVLTIPNTNVGGYENTGWDLVSNGVGATLAMCIARATAGREQCSGDGGMMSDEFALPPYTYVPGRSPHPVSDERGHAFGQASPDDWTAGDWIECRAYQTGRRLFAAGYYWEPHEAWEAVWLRLGRKGAEADFVKGLIKLAAAGVKCLEGNAIGATRHARRAAELFAVAGDVRGVDADRWRHLALTIADEPPVCDPPSEGSSPSPLRGFVLAE